MKTVQFVSALLCLTVLCGTAVSCRSSSRGQEAAGLPDISVSYPVVDSVVLYQSYPGYLSSWKSVDLVARVNGYIEAVSYVSGQMVDSAQQLFVIEPTQYQDALKQAQSNLTTAKAHYYYARNNYTRMKEASRSDAISTIDLIQYRSEMEQAQAAVASAEAALSSARTQLGYCYIRAPFSGLVSKNIYGEGAYVNGATQQTVLATIYNDTKVFANFSIEDNQYLQMLIRQTATKRKSVLPDRVEILFNRPLPKRYYGILDYMSPNVDLSTGTLSVRAVVENPDGELKNGMYVSVLLPYGTRPKGILVRDASIGTDQLGKYVYTVDADGRVMYRPIEVGQLVGDTMRLVNSGLSPDDRYVTKALLKVHDGMRVNPVLESVSGKQ